MSGVRHIYVFLFFFVGGDVCGVLRCVEVFDGSLIGQLEVEMMHSGSLPGEWFRLPRNVVRLRGMLE